MPGPLHVTVNGRSVELESPCSIRRLLEMHTRPGSPCAVEVNEVLVPRREHDGRILREGDRVEIVTLVGGG